MTVPTAPIRLTRFCPPRTRLLAALCGMAMAASAVHAQQVFTESEPNDSKAAANVVPFLMNPGDQLTGTTTGSSTTTAGLTSADYYKLDLATAAPNIYRQRLVMTSPNTGTYAGTIRGLDIDDGAVDPASDVSVVFSTSALQYTQWYGFGKGEEFFYRIERSGGTTTQPYTVTLERTPVTPLDASTTFATGPITVSSVGLPATNTDFWVYDANFDPVPTFGNEDATPIGGAPPGAGSFATRILAPGTYYVAISTFNLANDQPPAYDDPASSIANVWQFPGGVSNSASSANVDVSFRITDDAGNTELVAATKQEAFDVVFVRFQVGATTDPVGVPSPVAGSAITPGTSVVLSVAVTPAAAAITGVTADLTALGGSATASLFDNGANGDAVAGDGVYSLSVSLPNTIAPGLLAAPFRITDAAGRDGTGRFVLFANPVVPPNDTCDGARAISDGALPLTLRVGASLAGDDQDISCNFSNLGAANNGVWFSYTPAQTCLFTANETGSLGVAWQVYTGDCTTLQEFDCSNAESVTFQLTGNVSYRILLSLDSSTRPAATDAYDVTFSCATPPPPPANDDCAGAAEITGTLPYTNVVNIGGATTDIFTACSPLRPGNNGVWYTYVAPADVIAQIAETGPEFGRLAAFVDQCPISDGFDIFCDTVANLTTSPTRIPLQAGRRYYFLLHRSTGFAAANATFTFVFNTVPTPPVANPDCATATVVNTIPFSSTVNILGARDDQGITCASTSINRQRTNSGVWYAYTPAQDTQIVYRENSPLDAIAEVYVGSCGSLATHFCNSTFADAVDIDTVLNLSGGQTYYFLVGKQTTGLPANADTLTFEISSATPLPAAPANDLCENATLITGASFSDIVANGNATNDAETSCSAGTITDSTRHGVWYRYTSGPQGGTATLSEGTAQDMIIAVFTGDCGFPTEVACINNTADSGTFALAPSTAYRILVGRRSDTFAAPGDQIAFGFSVTGGGCAADFNGSGAADVTDIFAFLSAWFAQGPGSDFNGSGATDVTDIFAFLSAWFAGC